MRRNRDVHQMFEDLLREMESDRQTADSRTQKKEKTSMNLERLKTKGAFVETYPGSNVAYCEPNIEFAGCEIIVNTEFTVIE